MYVVGSAEKWKTCGAIKGGTQALSLEIPSETPPTKCNYAEANSATQPDGDCTTERFYKKGSRYKVQTDKTTGEKITSRAKLASQAIVRVHESDPYSWSSAKKAVA